ncbi:MAG: Hsp33 family molecular chaperone HslO [Bdellovibrionota bacterium]|nr:Hsp33 family molecular chaperone HslO [Bdellovibrionota bacterium]
MSQAQPNHDIVKKYLSKSGTVRVSCVIAQQLIAELQNVHPNMSPVASVAMGRATLSACLLASQAKNGKTGLHFQGNGPIGELFVEASFEGSVRGYIANPQFDLALKDGKIDVSSAIGVGLLNVVRTLPYQKQPFNGTVIIKTGEIGSDIAWYLQQSHQIPSVVALGEHINEYGLLTAAGGLIIELMPGHTEQEIKTLEENVKNAKDLSKILVEGGGEKEILEAFLKGIELMEIEHEHELTYSCTCTQEKVERSILFLSENDIQELLVRENGAEVTCEFCSKQYSVDKTRLNELLEEVRKNAMH